jgi:hypothetical protein
MRVLSVKRLTLDVPVPVYDLTVSVTENFRLAAGPVVHNSKDVSDALAGVVYGLTMRRELWALHGVPAMTMPQSIKQSMASEKVNKLSTVV